MSKRMLVALFVFATFALAIFFVVDAAAFRWSTMGPGHVEGSPWRETALAMVGWAALAVTGGALLLGIDRVVIARGAAIASVPIALGAFALFGCSPIIPDLARSHVPHVDFVELSMLCAPVLAAFVWRRRGGAREAAMANGAMGVLAVAMLLVVVRGTAPPPSGYLRSLTTTVPILDQRSFDVDGHRYEIVTSDTPALPSSHAWRQEPAFQDYGCFLEGPNGRMPLGNLWQDQECKLGWYPYSTLPDDPAIAPAIYLDASRRYAILYQPEGTGPYMERSFAGLDHTSAPRLCDGCGTYAMALRASDGARIELGPRTIGWQLSVPRAISVASFCGAVLTLYFFVRMRRTKQRDDALAAYAVALVAAAPLVGAHVAGI